MSPRYNLDKTIWHSLPGFHGLSKPNPYVMVRLLFYPYRGLFFYYPVLLFSFIGLYSMYKQSKEEAVLILSVFFCILFFNSSWWFWHGGAFFGPKLLTPSIPFLVIPLIYVLQRRDAWIRVTFFVLLSVSIMNNLLGLAKAPESTITDVTRVSEEYKEKINSFQMLANPLKDYYLPTFLKHGPRSRILEAILNKDLRIDIRDEPLSKGRFYPYLSHFYVNFSALGLLFLLIVSLWVKSILNRMLESKPLFLGFIVLVTIILSLCLFEQKKGIMFTKDWYELNPDEEGRWMYLHGVINIVSNESKEVALHLSMKSYLKDREVNLYWNGRDIGSYDIFAQGIDVFTSGLRVNKGMNTLEVRTNDCDVPREIEGIEDKRCLSVSVLSIEIIPLKDVRRRFDGIIYAKNWYRKEEHEELRWMKNDGTLHLYIPINGSVPKRFVFTGRSYFKDRTLYVYSNGELSGRFRMPSYGLNEYKVNVNLRRGENTIVFHTQEGCSVVKDVEGWNDTRCLSFGLKEVLVTQV